MESVALETQAQSGALVKIQTTDGLQIDQNPAIGYLAALRTEEGRRVQRQALASVARLLRHDLTDAPHHQAILSIEWHCLNNAHLKAIATRLATLHSPKTANRKLDAVRGVLKQAWLNGLMTRDEYERAVAIERIPGERLRRGRDISGGEIRALFESCAQEKTLLGSRDAAMMGLMFGGGLRRAEVANLRREDWLADRSEITVRRGKGNKDRLVPLPAGAARALTAWLDRRGPIAETDPLVGPVSKGGKPEKRKLTTQAIWKALCARAKKAGVDKLSPHDFRRTYAGDLLDAGADLSTVQKLMGHSDPKVTAGYDRRGQEARRRAADLVHVPFVKE